MSVDESGFEEMPDQEQGEDSTAEGEDLSYSTIFANDRLTSDSAPSPLPTIQGYRITGKLGAGGMGQVYLAVQAPPLSRRVALKVIQGDLESNRILSRFKAEQESAAMMDHPNIASIFDAGLTHAGKPYFAMEYVDGVAITKYCDEKKLDLRQRLRLFSQVCDAIHHAHQKGIIHRDIKPSNVMVTEIEARPLVKVIDFGLAKAMTPKEAIDGDMTQFGEILGTLRYMSPEQTNFGSLDVDTRADVYSLGVVLYELLSGSTPLTDDQIRGKALDAVLRSIREDEPAAPSSMVRDHSRLTQQMAQGRSTDSRSLATAIAGELDWIAIKAIAKDRKDRYESAASLRDDIQRYLNNEVVLASPPSTTYRMRKFVKRHRWAVTTAAMITLMTFASITGLASFAAWARTEAARANNEATRANAEATRANVEAERANAERTRAIDAEAAAIERQRQAEQLNQQLIASNTQLNNAIRIGFGMLESMYAGKRDLLNSVVDQSRRKADMDGSDPSALARMKVFQALPYVQVLINNSNAGQLAQLPDTASESSFLQRFRKGFTDVAKVSKLIDAYVTANKLLAEAIDLDPDLGIACLMHAQLITEAFTNSAETETALRSMGIDEATISGKWDGSVRLLPNSTHSHAGRGSWCLAQGDTVGAARDLAYSLQLDPANEIALKRSGQMAERNQDYVQAVEFYRRCYDVPEGMGVNLFGMTLRDFAGHEAAALTFLHLVPDSASAVEQIESLAIVRYYGSKQADLNKYVYLVWECVASAFQEASDASDWKKLKSQLDLIRFAQEPPHYQATRLWLQWAAALNARESSDALRDRFLKNFPAGWSCELTEQQRERILAATKSNTEVTAEQFAQLEAIARQGVYRSVDEL